MNKAVNAKAHSCWNNRGVKWGGLAPAAQGHRQDEINGGEQRRRAEGRCINHFPGYFRSSQLHEGDLLRRSPACWCSCLYGNGVFLNSNKHFHHFSPREFFISLITDPCWSLLIRDQPYSDDVSHPSTRWNDKQSSWFRHTRMTPSTMLNVFHTQTPGFYLLIQKISAMFLSSDSEGVDKKGGSLLHLRRSFMLSHPTTWILPRWKSKRSTCLHCLTSASAPLHWLHVETRCSHSFYGMFYCFHRCSRAPCQGARFLFCHYCSIKEILRCCCCKNTTSVLPRLVFVTPAFMLFLFQLFQHFNLNLANFK